MDTTREVLFGGAAGGGKTDALLMAALQLAGEPGYAALILRRSYADLALPDAVMDRSHQWLRGSPARWDDREKTWHFPSGATLSFGYLEHEADKWRYQGASFGYLGWDELTQHTESSYRYLFSRLRRPAGAEWPLRVRAASNPGGIGHEWVRQRFLTEGRPFIPSRLADNPHLDREAYSRALAELDPFTRRQLLEGDWFAQPPGTMFRREWFPVRDAPPVEVGRRRVRQWDLAATADGDWSCGVLVSTRDGIYTVEDVRRTRSRPGGVELLVRQTAEIDGRGVPIRIEQEPGASGVSLIDHYARHVLPGYDLRGRRATGSKEVRAAPVSSAAEAGNVHLVRGAWITDFLDELSAFPGGSHDDIVDALSGAVAELTAKKEIRWA